MLAGLWRGVSCGDTSATMMEVMESKMVEVGGRRVVVEVGREGKADVACASLLLFLMLAAVASRPGMVAGCAELLWLGTCAAARSAGASFLAGR